MKEVSSVTISNHLFVIPHVLYNTVGSGVSCLGLWCQIWRGYSTYVNREDIEWTELYPRNIALTFALLLPNVQTAFK